MWVPNRGPWGGEGAPSRWTPYSFSLGCRDRQEHQKVRIGGMWAGGGRRLVGSSWRSPQGCAAGDNLEGGYRPKARLRGTSKRSVGTNRTGDGLPTGPRPQPPLTQPQPWVNPVSHLRVHQFGRTHPHQPVSNLVSSHNCRPSHIWVSRFRYIETP